MITGVKPLTPDSITPAAWAWIPPREAVVDAWRQAHWAAQAASNVGKSWGRPKDDDSHSALEWVAPERALCGEAVDGEQTCRGALVIETMTLGVADSAGSMLTSRPLNAETLADATAWIRGEVERLTGSAERQPAIAPPDLPDHPVGRDQPFDTRDTQAFADVAEAYASMDDVLRRLRERVGAEAGPGLCWPHHFDHASLVTIERDDAGAEAATIGVGLAPPDNLSAHGYVYVSPWLKDRKVSPEGPLSHGRWVGSMATLSLAEIYDAGRENAPTVVAGFVASAFNACLEGREHG